MTARDPKQTEPTAAPPAEYGPPPFLKAVVIALVGAALALTLELIFGGVEPRWWRSLGIGVGLGLGFLAYEVWIRRRRNMISEGRDPDAPKG
ncbi:hypothetical protein [Caenispirillum salinarum]|uniref:hypothetical protein n=1 Tax=Caenispirillum salinarum TaxID=859058 RepID=UPI00384B9325